MRILVVTDDSVLFRKIELELGTAHECVRAQAPDEEADAYLIDRDFYPDGGYGISMSRYGDSDLPLPFRIGALKSLLTPGATRRLTMNGDVVSIGARAIRLTDVELALFRALYDRNGEEVSREELLAEVWGEGVDGGILNVYVHYLRTKLEGDGKERIIIAARGRGYRINKEFLGGAL